MSTQKRELSKTAQKRLGICRRRGHKLVIIKEGDAEVPSTCSDHCGRCGHRFSPKEARDFSIMSGVWLESYEDEVMRG